MPPSFRNDQAIVLVRGEPTQILESLADLLRDLRDVGSRVIDHADYGGCPDNLAPHGPPPSARAEGCPACDVLRRVDALLGEPPLGDTPDEPVVEGADGVAYIIGGGPG